MTDGISKQINSPHFYEDVRYDKTFEDLMNQSVGGISKHKDTAKMHLWLPCSATQEQIELIKRICGKI